MNALAARVLVVENDAHSRHFVRRALQSQGHLAFEAETLHRGLIDAGTRRPDLVVVAPGPPEGDGVDFIRSLRGWSAAPVIVLSERGGEDDKIAALDAGADDYVVKPVGTGELMARVRAQLRRRTQQAPGGESSVRLGDVVVDLESRRVERGGQPLHLTPIEYRLLTQLAMQPDRVIPHRQLLKAVWGPSHVEDTHYVRVHMANLRKKIEADAPRPRHLVTEAGVGYRFVP